MVCRLLAGLALSAFAISAPGTAAIHAAVDIYWQQVTAAIDVGQ